MQCIRIALLMISILVQCNKNKSAMHWRDCIAYVNHSCECIRIALHMMSIVMQCNRNCIGIKLLMINIVVPSNKNRLAMHWNYCLY